MSEQPIHNLDKNKVNDLLENVLDSCDIPSSSKSLDSIMLKRKLESKPLLIFKYVSLAFLILAICTPLAFRPDPDFSIVSKSPTVAVTNHSLYESCFVMTLIGDADYKNIYAKKDDGTIILPDTADDENGVVIFPYNGDSLNIYIPTVNGTYIQAVLHEKK